VGVVEANAWILHKRPISDSSYYVTFFTEEKGLIVALFRSNKKQALLQQFTPFWVDFTEKIDKFYVNKLEQKSASLNFKKHSLFAGLYINELLYYLLKPEDENKFLFINYETTLKKLCLIENSSTEEQLKEACLRFPEILHNPQYDSTMLNLTESSGQVEEGRYPKCQQTLNSIEITLRSFEFKLLQAIGYGVSLTLDIEKDIMVEEDKYYSFIPDRGIVGAEQGILGKYLLDIVRHDFSDELVLKAAKKITRAALDYFLGGRKLKSRDLYVKN